MLDVEFGVRIRWFRQFNIDGTDAQAKLEGQRIMRLRAVHRSALPLLIPVGTRRQRTIRGCELEWR
jgi:hypothetical protein